MANWRRQFGEVLKEGEGHLNRLRATKDRALSEASTREGMERRAREDRKPIGARDWIDNEYFSGSLARTMYPKLKDILVRIVDEGIHVVIMGGATRYGKTVLSLALQGRSKYENNCLGSPQRTYNLMDESNLLYMSMNITDQKARDAYFTKFSTWVRSTPYFRKEFSPLPHVITQLRFPKNILTKCSGAQRKAVESEDLFFFVGDEVNEYEIIEKSRRSRGGDKYDAAEDIEAEVIRRMQGTFMRPDGTYPSPCKIIWLCKETYPGSFIRRKIEEIRRGDLEKKKEAIIIESTEWGMKPLSRGTTYFWIRTGNRTQSARVIRSKKEAKKERAISEDLEKRNVPVDERFKIIKVPMVYLGSALKKLEEFIRSMCGIPTEAISAFFKEREPIFRAIRKAWEMIPGSKNKIPPDVCMHPFTEETTNTRDGVRLIRERLAARVRTGNMVVNPKTGEEEDEYVWQPIINPGTPRFIGIDAGLSGDACGFVMAHRCGWVTVLRRNDDNEPVEEVAPIIWKDLILRITPPPDGQIPFAGIRALVYAMSRLGFGIGKITCDSFQHVAITQPLEEHGYDVEVVSVVRTPDAYNMSHQAYSEGRVSNYPYPWLERELGKLERVVTGNIVSGRVVERIDHPPHETKDCADADAQVIQQVEKDSAEVAKHAARPETMPLKDDSGMVAQEQRAHTRDAAFHRGDFEGMMEMEKEDDEGYW